MTDKYIVWVGASDDHYDNYGEAKEAHDEWVEKGYDDVIIETISEQETSKDPRGKKGQ